MPKYNVYLKDYGAPVAVAGDYTVIENSDLFVVKDGECVATFAYGTWDYVRTVV